MSDKPSVEEILKVLFDNTPLQEQETITPPTDRWGIEVVRVSSTLPVEMVDEIDSIAIAEGLYRSQVIRRAVTEYIETHYG
jgi:Ribbon-helix-helix protein, copG family